MRIRERSFPRDGRLVEAPAVCNHQKTHVDDDGDWKREEEKEVLEAEEEVRSWSVKNPAHDKHTRKNV